MSVAWSGLVTIPINLDSCLQASSISFIFVMTVGGEQFAIISVFFFFHSPFSLLLTNLPLSVQTVSCSLWTEKLSRVGWTARKSVKMWGQAAPGICNTKGQATVVSDAWKVRKGFLKCASSKEVSPSSLIFIQQEKYQLTGRQDVR